LLTLDGVANTTLAAWEKPPCLITSTTARNVRIFILILCQKSRPLRLVYFGYPQAHEDNAERAVRAALEAIAAVEALKFSVPLQTGVGIATGLVVVGDLIEPGEVQERRIIGETPNIAARLHGLAEPNGVVIAESTRRLLGNLFELGDLGLQELEGIPSHIRAWAAPRHYIVEGRFEALHTGGLTELVGREDEVELRLRRWSKAHWSKELPDAWNSASMR
jgi:hypothetical protein